MKAKILKILFWVFLVSGVLSIFLGVLIPLFFGNLVDDGLRDLWLKPDDYDKWGETPGDNDIKIVRSFMLYNITNLPQLLNGTQGKLTELPPATFQEYSKMFNWEYKDENFDSLGKEKAGEYIAYNYKTDLHKIPSNTTVVPDTAPVTSVNYLTYFTFYGLSHSPAPLYMIPAMYEVVNALENDFYNMILSYVCFKTNISDINSTTSYLEGENLNPTEIINDLEYGWGKWETLKPWIESLLDLKLNNSTDTFFSIQVRFQSENLINLISEGSVLYELVNNIQNDMLTRYGTNHPVDLGQLQWSTGIVTFNLPLNLGTLSIPNTGVPLPSFIMMNKTFSTFPEEFFLQLALKINTPLFAQNASKLMEVSYTYPRTNNQSFLNLNNLGVLFTDPEAAKELFGFDDTQLNTSKTYLGSLVNFPVKAYNVSVDGYTMHLTKVASNSFVQNTVALRNDAYWSVPTILVFQNFSSQKLTCEAWVSQIEPSISKICNSSIGWNTTSKNWEPLELWLKAAYKNSSSSEYKTLLTAIPESLLNRLLYENTPDLYSFTLEALKNTSGHYKCKKSICNYEELFYLQWSTSTVTMGPPTEVLGYVSASSSMMSWLPKRYLVPIEWINYGSIPVYPLASKALSYSYFLNPGVIRAFFNSYFQGNLTQTALAFQLPSAEYVTALYNYLLKIIPGLSFFQTRTYGSWMNGFLDYYTYYVSNLSIYQGGMPTLSPYGATAANATDDGKPKHLVYSGRLDTTETKFYYKYFDSREILKYGNSYDEYSATMKKPVYTKIWNAEMEYDGGDGGQFGTQVNDEDTLTVFISAIYRNVNMTYDSDTTYHGLGLSRFLPVKSSMYTSAKEPDNSKFNQFAHGYEGFMNLSSQYNSPVFVSYKRCYKCEEAAQNMYELREYKGVGLTGDKIKPDSDDSPYAEVEPLTGTGVRVYLNLELRVGFYNDYFFKGFYEPIKGKGVSFPMYTLERRAALSKHQVNKFFGNLQQIKELRRIVFLIGVIVGSAFIALSLICGVFIYRRNKFKTWSSPRNTLIKRYVTMKTENEFRNS